MPAKKGEGTSKTASKTGMVKKTTPKTAAAKPAVKKTAPNPKTTAAKPASKIKAASVTSTVKKTPSAAKKTTVKTATPKTTVKKTAPVKKTAAKTTAKAPAKKTAVKTAAKTAPVKKAATNETVKKAPIAKTAATKTTKKAVKSSIKNTVQKETVKKAPAAKTKTAAANAGVKKRPATTDTKKTASSKIPVNKTPVAQTADKKTTVTKEADKKSLVSMTKKNPPAFKSELPDFSYGYMKLDFWKRSGIIVNKNDYSETEIEIEATADYDSRQIRTRVSDQYTRYKTTIAVKDSSNAVFTVNIPESSIDLFEGNKVTVVGMKKKSKETGYYCIIKNETTKKWFLIYSARQMKFGPSGILSFLIPLALIALAFILPAVGLSLIGICLIYTIVFNLKYIKKLNKHLFEIGYFLNIPSKKNTITMAEMRKAYRKSKPSGVAWIQLMFAVLVRLLSGNNDMTNTIDNFSRTNRNAHNCIE